MAALAAIIAITVAIDRVRFYSGGDLRLWVKGIAICKPALVLTPTLHHDLVPNLDVERARGPDRYRLRTGQCAGNGRDIAPGGAIFVLGDSFTEVMGLEFKQAFRGMIACPAHCFGRVAYDLGVRSYSPILYHRKARDVAKRLGLTPTEIVVFLDISDIQDDAEIYEERDGEVRFRQNRPPITLRYDVVEIVGGPVARPGRVRRPGGSWGQRLHPAQLYQQRSADAGLRRRASLCVRSRRPHSTCAAPNGRSSLG